MADRFAGPLDLVRYLFNRTARPYADVIDAALAPLAADFAAWIAPSPADHVLDVGAGTGYLARLIAPRVRRVTALDAAQEMLRAGPAIRRAVVGDLHKLPFRAGQFSLITASFALNATDPARSLRALRRVIAPGGGLAIQEWGPATALDHAFADAFADCRGDDPPAGLAALRAALATWPGRWGDHLQDVDDYEAWLHAAGFRVEHAAEIAPVALKLNIPQFVTYKLAWTDRHLEMAARAPAARAACEAALVNRLAAWAAPADDLVWRPVVFRVRARA